MIKAIEFSRIRNALKGKKLVGFKMETTKSKNDIVKVGKVKGGKCRTAPQ